MHVADSELQCNVLLSAHFVDDMTVCLFAGNRGMVVHVSERTTPRPLRRVVMHPRGFLILPNRVSFQHS